jgi:hypothetical protein
MGETKILKINNPLYVANLVPLITDFLSKVSLPNINVHSMVALFQRTSQMGNEIVELWAIFEDNEPIGFGHWGIRDLPLIGTVHLDFLYCKGNRKDLVIQIISEFDKFGVKHHSPWYMCDVVDNPKLIAHLTNLVHSIGFEEFKQPYIPYLGRKKNG